MAMGKRKQDRQPSQTRLSDYSSDIQFVRGFSGRLLV